MSLTPKEICSSVGVMNGRPLSEIAVNVNFKRSKSGDQAVEESDVLHALKEGVSSEVFLSYQRGEQTFYLKKG
jgi:hypothetical protein